MQKTTAFGVVPEIKRIKFIDEVGRFLNRSGSGASLTQNCVYRLTTVEVRFS